MLKEVYRVDENGYREKTLVIEVGNDGTPINKLEANIITVKPPCGLYRAKWTGTEWIEDMSQEEIDALNNKPQPLTEIEVLRLEQAKANAEIVELMMSMFYGGAL